MTTLFMESFDQYGTGSSGRARMLDGVWAEIEDNGSPNVPSFGARTGNVAYRLGSGFGESNSRLVFPAAETEFIMGFGFYLERLPITDEEVQLNFRDAGNTTLLVLIFRPDGSIVLSTDDSVANAVASSQGPVLVAGTWQHLEMKLAINASTGSFELRYNGDTSPKIDASNINTGSTDVSQISFVNDGISGTDIFWIDDLVIRDTAGSVNNGFNGDTQVATLVPDSDETVNWTPRYRLNLGNGVLDIQDDDRAVSVPDSADFEFGSGDYTVEGWVRFHRTSQVTRQIIGKWQTNGDLREWTLELTGDNDTDPNQLRWLVSTDGSAETVVHTWPFQPLLFKWYYFAVVRDGTDSYLFLDGDQLGVTRTDSATYHAGTAALALGARMSSASAVIDNTGVNGLMDEVRITKGVARYTASFTPPSSEFPRSAPGDSDFASVTLLAGFNNETIADESDSANTMTARNGAVAILPDDGTDAYTAINQLDPRDDTVIEAALLPATGVYTFVSNPTNGQTITLGATTYEFVTSLSSADDVLIGAALTDTIDNLVAAINDAGGEGTVYGTGTTANASANATRVPDPQVLVTALTPGTGGNSIATTGTAGGGSWDAATMSGGVSIPGTSTFGLSRLPPDTTQIKAIQIVTRAYKTDAGVATIQSTFVGPSAATADGTEKTLTTDATYRYDIFEEDPDTSAAITPPTLVNGAVRINRTS